LEREVGNTRDFRRNLLKRNKLGSTWDLSTGREEASLNPKQLTAQRAREFLTNALVRRGYKVQEESSRNEKRLPSHLCFESPSGKEFVVKVLGQSTRKFWRYEWKEPNPALYYAFVFVPFDEAPRVFIMESEKAMELWDEYKNRMMQKSPEKKHQWGIPWVGPHPYEGRYDLIPG
jgi:hypothetical protein